MLLDDDDIEVVMSALPEGKTCADCRHFAGRCRWLLSYDGTETACDWSPSRFKPPQPRAEVP